MWTHINENRCYYMLLILLMLLMQLVAIIAIIAIIIIITINVDMQSGAGIWNHNMKSY